MIFCGAPLPIAARYRPSDGLWWLTTVSLHTTTADRYVVQFVDNPGSMLLALPSAAYLVAIGANCGSWFLQTWARGSTRPGIFCETLTSYEPPWPFPPPSPLCSSDSHRCYFGKRHLCSTGHHGATTWVRDQHHLRSYYLPRTSASTAPPHRLHDSGSLCRVGRV